MKDRILDLFLFILMVAIVGTLIATGIALDTNRTTFECEQLANRTGRSTELRDYKCYIKIAPELFAPVDDLVHYLDRVDPNMTD